ncbi:hypothetical protein B6U90_03085 [Thermoplasmatales archaeon ex4484_6]|nr:MAG: hypothetical protein B6U90_03085 [Thermoplasmatales archaeon ex4484_6]RLF68390.1 MAG: DUF711 domain-containing protein [Thermoplasmata archaeon]
MKVRTVTAGVDLDPGAMDEQIEDAGNFLSSARERFTDSGLEVQTVRLSTQPWSDLIRSIEGEELVRTALDIERRARAAGIDYISLGPSKTPGQISLLPLLFGETTFVCASAFLGNVATGPLENNIRAASRVTLDIAAISPDGSRNFMFSSCACCPPDIPFFPAAYHGRGGPSFTVGLENGDIVYGAAMRASELSSFRELLSYEYSSALEKVENICQDLERDGDLQYRGIDTSIAPGLGRDGSVALSIEKLTGSPFGSHGTLSAAATITSSLPDLGVKSCGYSGLMLPVMEDDRLAECADMGSLDLQKLLLYSSVCGTGLDAVPIPGNTSIERISGVLRDVAHLSIRWGKPLSARLLPIPNRIAGEMTNIHSPYLRNCSVISVI